MQAVLGRAQSHVQAACSSRALATPSPSSTARPGFMLNVRHRQEWDGSRGTARDRRIGVSAVSEVSTIASGLLGSGFEVDGPASVATAIGIMCAIVGFHEFGHFSAARALGIHVSKFSIGFGPKVAGFERDGVEYMLCAFPLGGFVAFPDAEADESPYDESDPDLLQNRPVLDRFIVTSAGIVANIMFAYAVLFGQALNIGVVDPVFLPGVQVPMVVQGSPGEAAGIKAGDIITRVGGVDVPARDRGVPAVVSMIRDSPGVPITLHVNRNGTEFDVDVVPDASPSGGRIGVQLVTNVEAKYRPAQGLADAATAAWRDMTRLSSAIATGLGQIFTNFTQAAEQVSGPVAIVAVGAEVVRRDAAGAWQFAAIVNLNLAAMNALPLPGLDGGYLALQLAEAVRGGKRLPQQLERGIMSSGFLLLTATGLFLIVRDTLNLTGL